MMSIKMQTIEHRPNTSVAFWEKPSEYSEHIKSSYIDTNFLLTPTTEFSADQLTRTVTYIWDSLPGLLRIVSEDEHVINNYTVNKTYNEVSGIVRESTKFVHYNPNNDPITEGIIKNINL